jgi:hypothetical protein
MVVNTRVKNMGRRNGCVPLVRKRLKEEPLARSRRRSKDILRYESRNVDLRTWPALTCLLPSLITVLRLFV